MKKAVLLAWIALSLLALVILSWAVLTQPHGALDWKLAAGLGTAAVLTCVMLWKIPQWQTLSLKELAPEDKFDRENEARKTLAQVLGGIILLAGFYYTWRNITLTQQSLDVSQRSLAISQQGQITDRFTKAIEQLGAIDASGKKKLELRLGGIYALERIANESERDHWPIMEVLAAYVRENAPQKMQGSPSHPRNRYPADVQAVIVVIGRRNQTSEQPKQTINLTDVDLMGADLPGLDLRGVDLRSANLSHVNLIRTNLRAAYLTRTDLTWAELVHADLTNADLREAQMTSTNLSRATLVSAICDGADLKNADLMQADLTGANLGGATLAYANLRMARLTKANLTDANLWAAELSGANLSGAKLSGADLRFVTGLTQQQIDQAQGDSKTQVPPQLHAPPAWKGNPIAPHENEQ